NSHDSPEEIYKKHRMLMWEGSILIATVVMGGGSLIFLSYRDQRRHEQLQTFFATFSHDIKTSITRLRLQAEILEEDNIQQKNPVLQRLVGDIARLDLQLENSLLLSSSESAKLLREKLLLSKIIESMRGTWGELEFRLKQDAEIFADKRALSSVLKNLIQNAVLHGQASVVELSAKSMGSNKIEICIQDNGKGFTGNIENLGKEMYPSRAEKGSGIGLYLGRLLLERMKGNLRFERSDQGLRAMIRIEGQVV
ncbi:MAG: HAMP domain-containing histidine kinase, partial [Bdellovibrionaceae bacterium]|nr:HAMP domain-containing histidine kinase [Pseudobdellovibrionaceae bacterium]